MSTKATGKKVVMGTRPTTQKAAQVDADSWVENRGEAPATVEPAERTKRLTIDVEESLHQRFKAACSLKGTKISIVARELITEWLKENS